MSVYTLLDGVSAGGAGSSIAINTDDPGRYGTVQAIISGTATVELQGSLDDTNWFQIKEFTASGGASFDRPPHIRGNVTSYTSGTVTLKTDV